MYGPAQLPEVSMTAGTGATPPALGLFVVWPRGRGAEERIVRHVRKLFEIRRVYEISRTRDLIAVNYRRFLGRSPGLPSSLQPPGEERPILLLTAVDSAPRYAHRMTPNGPAQVNARLFDAAQLFRAWAGGASCVHASHSATEAARDLMLLLGTDPKTHLEGNPHPWSGRIERIHRDLSGADGWSSPSELFHTLNHTVRYVVLRNFEGLPDSLHVGSHEDVDLLTDDYPGLVAVMNARPNLKCIPRWGGPFWVKICGQDMWFDLRFAGDRYYDPKWAREILDRRVWNSAGFFSPNATDYFESLAYHAVVHKNSFSTDYKQRLAGMAGSFGLPGWETSALEDPTRVKTLLDGILKKRGCAYCRPRDVNVFYNFEATGHRWPHLRRKLAALSRKALRVGYRLHHRLIARYRAASQAWRHKAPWVTASRRSGAVGSSTSS